MTISELKKLDTILLYLEIIASLTKQFEEDKSEYENIIKEIDEINSKVINMLDEFTPRPSAPEARKTQFKTINTFKCFIETYHYGLADNSKEFFLNQCEHYHDKLSKQ